MVRMFSGFGAIVFGWLVGLLSPYRIILAMTIAVVGWGLLAGWVQWVVLGQSLATGGFGDWLAISLARWALFSWVGGVLLAPFCDDSTEDEIILMLFLCAFGTLCQGFYMHNVPPRPLPSVDSSIRIQDRGDDGTQD